MVLLNRHISEMASKKRKIVAFCGVSCRTQPREAEVPVEPEARFGTSAYRGSTVTGISQKSRFLGRSAAFLRCIGCSCNKLVVFVTIVVFHAEEVVMH